MGIGSPWLRRSVLLAIGLAPLPAAGGTLVAASLTIEAGTTIPPAMFAGSGVTGSSNGTLLVTLGAGSGFAGLTTVHDPTNAPPPISGYRFTAGSNALGSFSGASPGAVGGSMAVQVNFCAQAYGTLCILNLDLPVGTGLTVIPPPAGGIGITMQGSPWTAGTAAIPLSFTPGSMTRMGSNGLNPNGAGTLVLVSGVNVLADGAGQLPTFATLTLEFVPEPAALPLFGVAALALALGVRRRR